MKTKRRKIRWLVGVMGLCLSQFLSLPVFAADSTQDTAPGKVNITVHKLMYDQGTNVNIAIDGIKNDGYTHGQYPTGVLNFDKGKYGEVAFTLANITNLVLPKPDSELTNTKIDEIVHDVETKGANSEYIKKASNKVTQAVNENGETTFSNQPAYVNEKSNAYVLYESQSAAGLVTQKAKPMVVIAPMTDRTGQGFLQNIHLYPKNVVQKLRFELTKFSENGTAQSKQSPLKDAKFELYKGEPGKGTKLGDLVSDEQGKLMATDLTIGKYYFVEAPSTSVVGSGQEPTADQYLLGADARNDAHNKLTFEITNAGVKSDLVASYVNYKAPTIDKRVTNGSGHEHSFQIGDAVNYQGIIHIPTDISGGTDGITVNGVKSATSPYSVFKWGDRAGQGISYVAAKANIKVTNKDKSIVLKENIDYRLISSKDGFVLDFIVNNGKVSNALAALHGQDLSITYDMFVNDAAKIATPLSNNVDFVYNNNPFMQEEHHEKTKAVVVTYGAKFLKVDSGLFGTGIKATPLEGAEFVAKNAAGKYYGGLTDTDKDGVKEASWVDNVANAMRLKSDKDGHFELTGLCEGTYSLKEVKAPNNYQKLMKEISFKVDKDSYQEANRLTIKNNQKATIPMTGSRGFQLSVLFTCLLLGLGAMSATVYLKKKA
ncbi:isopeptide-forming domain-containing fimbrial protein [Enterococcus faecium]|nr:isopeptide-forming domain-containing fimbrial protein [Enterococcus faecium]EGP5602401.1 isopeptide-forming domain-containing fimbrial protein [Enterococcus faecium]EME7096355.1 isopeptide-forming domain-containing fimbrial protein [Enterococcus faecium]EME7159556.1 isopeptide-forming domain-containing fimbrial protein [Enterococcus faecium]EMF0589794.1 isopeptide-forming domain-containing fimbrial protein [Enterococcus faecium]